MVLNDDPVMDGSPTCLAVGTVVYARMSTYPSWPAIVSELRIDRAKQKQYKVYFLATYQYLLTSIANLVVYENIDQYRTLLSQDITRKRKFSIIPSRFHTTWRIAHVEAMQLMQLSDSSKRLQSFFDRMGISMGHKTVDISTAFNFSIEPGNVPIDFRDSVDRKKNKKNFSNPKKILFRKVNRKSHENKSKSGFRVTRSISSVSSILCGIDLPCRKLKPPTASAIKVEKLSIQNCEVRCPFTPLSDLHGTSTGIEDEMPCNSQMLKCKAEPDILMDPLLQQDGACVDMSDVRHDEVDRSFNLNLALCDLKTELQTNDIVEKLVESKHATLEDEESPDSEPERRPPIVLTVARKRLPVSLVAFREKFDLLVSSGDVIGKKPKKCSVKNEYSDSKSNSSKRKLDGSSECSNAKRICFSLENVLDGSVKLEANEKVDITQVVEELSLRTKNFVEAIDERCLELLKSGTNRLANSLIDMLRHQSSREIGRDTMSFSDAVAPKLKALQKLLVSEEREASRRKKQQRPPVDPTEGLPEIGKGPVCQICEDPTHVIKCQNCMLSYHLKCIGNESSSVDVDDFICNKCLDRVCECFACKQDITMPFDRETCSVGNCRRSFHLRCIEKFPMSKKLASGKFQCPHHVCAYCFSVDNKDIHSTKGNIAKCNRCPFAYHYNWKGELDSCIPAGTNLLSDSVIVCPTHYKEVKKNYKEVKSKSTAAELDTLHTNVNWCFFCSAGGQLLCCDQCPASFHIECVNLTEPPDPSIRWLCESCEAGHLPKYGEVVWAKLAYYRWWPAKIVEPGLIPDNVYRKNNREGDFVVRFYGTGDYAWLPLGRVFLFEENDQGNKDSEGRLNQAFLRSLVEANAAYNELCRINEHKILMAQEKLENRTAPPPFKVLTRNRPVNGVKTNTMDVDDFPVCTCTFKDPCTSNGNCVNRLTMIECHPSTCPVGDRCENQRFRLRQYASTTIAKCSKRGWGLQSSTDLKAGDFISEYIGEVIDQAECKKRILSQNENGDYNFYYCTLDKDRIIDASKRGNNARFVNHSCDPNCDNQLWQANGDLRIGIFACKDIPAGTELTFNYNLETIDFRFVNVSMYNTVVISCCQVNSRGSTKTPCFCGSDNCSGYIGAKPKSKATESLDGTASRRNKKKLKRKKIEKIHEDNCFKCRDGGSLILCSKINCVKSYHLSCLKLDKNPCGQWYCPWHFCDVCGKSSTRHCNDCDNSTCETHQLGVIHVANQGVLKCSDCNNVNSASLQLLLEHKTISPRHKNFLFGHSKKHLPSSLDNVKRNCLPVEVGPVEATCSGTVETVELSTENFKKESNICDRNEESELSVECSQSCNTVQVAASTLNDANNSPSSDEESLRLNQENYDPLVTTFAKQDQVLVAF